MISPARLSNRLWIGGLVIVAASVLGACGSDTKSTPTTKPSTATTAKPTTATTATTAKETTTTAKSSTATTDKSATTTETSPKSVSYTHLTLPTIYSV